MGAQLLGAAPGRVLETRHDGRVGDAEGRLALDERRHRGLVARAVRAPAPGGQQHRAAVEVEQEPVGDVEAELVEHPRQHRRRVVREVPVAQGVPAAVGHDRGQRVELQQQHTAGRGRGGALEQARALVGGVHEPEAVDDDVGRAVLRVASLRPVAASRSSQEPPCGLPNSVTVPPPPAGARPPRRARRRRRAWATSASGSAPRGSSGVVGSSASCASPHVAHSHIRSGCTASGPGSSRAGKWSEAGWSPRSSTTVPSGGRSTSGRWRVSDSTRGILLEVVVGGMGGSAGGGSHGRHRRRPGVRPDAPPRRPGAVHPHVRHRDRRGARHRPRRRRPRTASRARATARCAACTGGGAPARPSWCAWRTARCSTSSSTPGPGRRRSGGWRRSGSTTRTSGTSTCPRGSCTGSRRSPRSPTSATASTVRTPPGEDLAVALRRPRAGDRLAGARHRDLGARPHRRLLGRPARRSSDA